MDKSEIGYQDLMGDLGECEWIVNLDADENGARRIVVKASSEMGAILAVEADFGVTAISALVRR